MVNKDILYNLQIDKKQEEGGDRNGQEEADAEGKERMLMI